MRLRKKKHLDQRLNQVDNLLVIEGSDFYIKDQKDKYNLFDFSAIFNNDNPVHLELGCGKGGFAVEMAKKHPNINFVAVEKSSNVIVSACEIANQANLNNLKFANLDANNLLYYFNKNSISRIYLNFSCPYPKNTYANRRLTNYNFLNLYKEILTERGEIFQKTDNKKFFDFSIQQYKECGFGLKNICLDLANSQIDNVMTEYERNFTAQGKPIYRLEAYLLN